MNRTRIVALALLIVMLLSAFGCTAAPQDEANAPVAGEEASAAAENAAGLKVIKHNQEALPTCDPAGSNSFTAYVFQLNAYDTLVFPDSAGNVTPWLAETWETSEDGLTYTFHLRQGVKFHNGGELTASDVVFTMNRLMTMGIVYSYLWEDCFDFVEATDDYTVVFHLKSPFGAFVASLFRLYIVSEDEIMANLDTTSTTYGEFCDYGTAYLVEHDAGSGPFKVKEIVQQNYLLMERFDDFWNGWSEDAADQVKIVYTTEETTVKTMLLNGDINVSHWSHTPELETSVLSDSRMKVASFNTGTTEYFCLNTTAYPMDDVNFRKGLCCLLDYDEMCQFWCNATTCEGYINHSLPGAVTMENYYPYDPELAAEYFAASKYANEVEGMEFDVWFCNEDPMNEKLALYVQAAWAKAGINVNIKRIPFSTVIDNVATAETCPPLNSINNSPNYWDAGALVQQLFSDMNLGTWENSSYLNDAKLEAAIAKAIATVDEASRYEQLAEIQNYVMDLCPIVAPVEINWTTLYDSNLITFPAVKLNAEGKVFASLPGYVMYFHDFEFVK